MRFSECLSVVRRMALLCAAVAFSALADDLWNPYVVNRTVEVSPGARKNKAFPMAEGSALCDLHLMAKEPWRIRSSRIALRDDKTLWFKASDREYIIAGGYAPNEYVVVRGELEKPGGGSGKGAEERPQFQVTVPKVDLQWAAKHGEASQEEKEDLVPAVIMVSEDPNDFGTLIVCAPKDDFHLSDPHVTLTWTHPDAVKVYRGNSEVVSGASWLLMAGTQLELSVKVVRPEADVKFTLKGEPDVVSHERAVDYVRAMCAKVEFVTPAGDPVRAPKDVGDGQNEFTFSTANPGVLTMNLKARVTPAAAAPIMAADCHFEVGAVGTSAMAWAAANPRGKAIGNGGFLTATVAFTGLPDKNDAFGKKKAILLLNGRKLDENDYEVFFPKKAKNHPACRICDNCSNWFFYWAETAVREYDVKSGTYTYSNNIEGYAQYNSNVSNPKYTIAELAAGHECYTSAGLSVDRKGIDTCSATLRHEKQHLQTDLNWLPGGEWFGKIDSDGDELPDDWEDEHKSEGFKKELNESFSPDFVYGDDEEVWCEINALKVKGFPKEDWANPGKQSKNVF